MAFFDDPLCLTGPGGSPAERMAHALRLSGTLGQAYVEKRGIPLEIAEAAGVGYDPDFNGLPAVIAALRDHHDSLTSVHARYLQHHRAENKMLTIGPGGGLLSFGGGWQVEPLILVEGLFDALSLAVCGRASSATIGRWAPWLPEIARGRMVWIAFDATRPGESDFSRYMRLLPGADVRRLLPPPHCKDWNTALVKRGRISVTGWLDQCLGQRPTGSRQSSISLSTLGVEA